MSPKNDPKDFISETFICLCIEEKGDRWPTTEVIMGDLVGGNLIGSAIPLPVLEEKLWEMVTKEILGYFGEPGPKRQWFVRAKPKEEERPRIIITT